MTHDRETTASVHERSPLLGWLDTPRADRSIRFAAGEDEWREHPYDELAAAVRAAARQIQECAADRPVATIVLPSGADFVAAFYGAQLAGYTPSPVATPGAFRGLDEYRAHVIRIVQLADPGVLITDDAHADLLASALEHSGRAVPLLVLDARGGSADAGPVVADPADLALLQFTSGSSANPKGVRVTWSNLESCVAGVVEHLEIAEVGHVATWLPLHHDMGLIACLLTSVSAQASLSVVQPEQFVRRPTRWLRCVEPGRPTITVSAAFAFGYAASRVSDEDLASLDLSSWHMAGLGAERVGGDTLERFARRFARCGFRPEIFDPGYGMAEATLAVSGSDRETVPNAVRIEPGSLRLGDAVGGAVRPLTDVFGAADISDWLVSSGRPICGCEVRIVGTDGAELDEGRLGQIAVRGPVVADGYEGRVTTGLTRFTDGCLQTGDAGFVRDGELYVIGRMGDAISTRGRTVYLEDIEATVGGIEGITQGRFVVVAGPEQVVTVVEQDPGPWVPAVRAAMVRHVGGDISTRVRVAGRGTIQRTTSGKPRRRFMWNELLEGRLPGEDATA